MTKSSTINECLENILSGVKLIPYQTVAKKSGHERPLTGSDKIVISIRYLLKHSDATKTPMGVKNNKAYVYTGAYWQHIADSDLGNFLQEAVEKMGINWIRSNYFMYKERLVKQFYTDAQTLRVNPDVKTSAINLANGTFCLSAGNFKLRDFDCNDNFTYQLGFEYNPNATAPLFQSYLDKVLPDTCCQKILAEYLGYLFMSLKLEKVLILYGNGANGKSVFFEIAKALIGEQNICSYTLRNLTHPNGYYRALLENKILNYASELNECLETAVFKQLISGEPVEARLPSQKPFMLYDYPKFIFNCNELPIKVEQSNAYFRRFLIVPFEVTIAECEQDKDLSKKIIATELPGILNWVLAGMERLSETQSFTHSDAVVKLINKYKRESDTVKIFFEDEGYIPNAKEYTLASTLYNIYREFCIANGFKPVNSKNFRKRLLEDNIAIERGNDGQRIYVAKVQQVYKSDDADKNSTDVF